MTEQSKFAHSEKIVIKLDASGNTIEQYPSMRIAATKNNIRYGTLSTAIKRGTKCKGYRYAFVEEKKERKPVILCRTDRIVSDRAKRMFEAKPYGGFYSYNENVL